MVIKIRLGGKDLIALQRLDLDAFPMKSEIGSDCWCGKNVDGQVVMIAL